MRIVFFLGHNFLAPNFKEGYRYCLRGGRTLIRQNIICKSRQTLRPSGKYCKPHVKRDHQKPSSAPDLIQSPVGVRAHVGHCARTSGSTRYPRRLLRLLGRGVPLLRRHRCPSQRESKAGWSSQGMPGVGPKATETPLTSMYTTQTQS